MAEATQDTTDGMWYVDVDGDHVEGPYTKLYAEVAASRYGTEAGNAAYTPTVLFPLEPRTYDAAFSGDTPSYTYSEPLELPVGPVYVGINVTDWDTNASVNSILNYTLEKSFDGNTWFKTGSTITGPNPANYSVSATDTENEALYLAQIIDNVRYIRIGYFTMYDDTAEPPQTPDAQITFEISILY